MNLDPSNQPDLMCPGEKANYVCATSGLNVREDNPTKSTYIITCKTDQTYNIPNNWPKCVDKFDCKEPKIDSTVMTYDWTSGVTPEFDVK